MSRRAHMSSWVLVAASLSGCASQPTCADLERPDADAIEQRVADLTCVQRWLELERGWPEGAQAKAQEQLAGAREDAVSSSAPEFFLTIARIVALADNGHSNAMPAPALFGLLPIRTLWLDDGVYIVRAAPGQRELVGAKLLAIAGHSPAALLERMRVYVGGTDELFRAYFHRAYLLSPALLHAAGVGEHPDRVMLTLELDGETRDVEIAILPPSTDEAYPQAEPWRLLVRGQLYGEDPAWVSVFDRTDAPPLAWAWGEPLLSFRYRYLPDQRVAHVQLRANRDVGEHKLAAFLDQLAASLERDRPQHLIWDQRQNGGGDLTQTADFALALHEHLPADGMVYVLTSNGTFSAGIYTSMLPKFAKPDRTLIVGEQVGDRERFWAESKRPLTLPHANVRLDYALELHDLGSGCHDRKRCHIRNERWNLGIGSLAPDVVIPTRAAELFAGRDAQVEWVLANLASER